MRLRFLVELSLPQLFNNLIPLKAIKLVVISTTILSTASLSAYACTIPKSYYSNVFCTSSSRYFVALKDSGQPVALLNKQGKKAVDLSRYTAVDVNKLKDGLLPVQRGGRVGYLNMSGREIVPAIYDVINGDQYTSGWARAVNNDRIIVKKNGKFGIIDTKNSVILPFSSDYKTISDYNTGVAKIVKQNGTIWVDINARRTSNPKTEPAQPSNVSDPATSSNVTTSRALSQPTSQASADNNISSRFIVSGNEIWQPEKRDGKWGFVNRNSVPMIKFTFDQVTPFSEGLAGVRLDDKWGFVNLAGDLIIPFRFDEGGVIRKNGATYKGAQPFVFTQGKAWIGNLNNGDKLCVDTKGNNVNC